MKVLIKYPNNEKIIRELPCNTPASYIDINTIEIDEAPEIINWALHDSEHKIINGIECMNHEVYYKAKRYMDAYSKLDWLIWEAIHIENITTEHTFNLKDMRQEQIAGNRELTAEDLEKIYDQLRKDFQYIV